MGNIPTNLPKSGRIIRQKIQSSTNLGTYSTTVSPTNETSFNKNSFQKSHTLNIDSGNNFEEATKHLKFYEKSSLDDKESPMSQNIEEINWKLKYLEEKT